MLQPQTSALVKTVSKNSSLVCNTGSRVKQERPLYDVSNIKKEGKDCFVSPHCLKNAIDTCTNRQNTMIKKKEIIRALYDAKKPKNKQRQTMF